MTPTKPLAAVIGGVLAGAALSCSAQTGLDVLRPQQLEHLLRQDCGSCHGLRLTGGLGPPLTPQALAGKPRELLVATITHGRPGTPMPNWDAVLSAQDIAWLADRLLQGHPLP